MRLLIAQGPGGPEILRLVEAPIPAPQAGQVRIKVAYAALNPLDVLVRQGRVRWMAGAWPFAPGLEFGGIVESVGPGVDVSWTGRKVISYSEFGGCADYALAPVARLLPLDPALGWRVGIAWRTPTMAAWYLLNEAARLQAGETVMIHSAAGAFGIMAAQIAKDIGARVIGLAGGPEKIAYARVFGADMLFDYRQPDWPAQVGRYTEARGANVIIDGNGGPNAARNYEVVAPNGRVFHIGATSGMAAPQVAPPLLIARSFSVGGFNLNSIPEEKLAAVEPQLSAKIARGTWRFPIGEIVKLEEAASLHASFEARQLAGRAMIEVAGEI